MQRLLLRDRIRERGKKALLNAQPKALVLLVSTFTCIHCIEEGMRQRKNPTKLFQVPSVTVKVYNAFLHESVDFGEGFREHGNPVVLLTFLSD